MSPGGLKRSLPGGVRWHRITFWIFITFSLKYHFAPYLGTSRLATRVNEEAEERVTAAQARHPEQLSQQQQPAATLKIEALFTRQPAGAF